MTPLYNLLLSVFMFVVMTILMSWMASYYDFVLLFLGPVLSIFLAFIALAWHNYEYRNLDKE